MITNPQSIPIADHGWSNEWISYPTSFGLAYLRGSKWPPRAGTPLRQAFEWRDAATRRPKKCWPSEPFPGEEKTMETPPHTNILRYLNHLTLRPFGLVRQAVFWSEAVELSTCMRSWTSFSMRLGVIGENGAKAWNVNELQSIYSFTNKPSFWPVFLQDSCAFNIVDSQLTMFILFQH